jgi:hypothetical protein
MSTYEYHPGLEKLRNVVVVIPHGHITRCKLVMVLNEERRAVAQKKVDTSLQA